MTGNNSTQLGRLTANESLIENGLWNQKINITADCSGLIQLY